VTLHKEVEKLKVDLATNKTRIGSCENEITRINSRKDQLNKSLLELNEKIDDLTKDKEGYSKQKKSLIEELALLDTKITNFRKKHQLDKETDIETDIDKLDKEADDKQSEMQSLREEQQNMLREKDRLEFQIQTIDEKIDKVKDIEKEHKTELQNLKAKKQEFKRITLDLNKLINDDSNLAAELAQTRTKLISANENLMRLKTQGTHLKEKIARNISIEKIIENKGRLGGVYDTVSNLGKVTGKFSMALEIAAGARIKSIVVDSDATAAKCIDFLKKGQFGVATFLPLNKIKPSTDRGSLKNILDANGVHGLALDLITYDPKFKNVFSHVFGNTIVVDNISVARRIGVGVARMVTLDGDLVETSGAMVGGFRHKQARKYGFQEKEVLKDIDSAAEDYDKYKKLVESFEKTRSENEKEISKLREDKAQLEGEIIKLEKSLHLDSADLDSSKKVKEDFKDELKVIDKKLQEIDHKIASANKLLSEVKVKKQQQKAQIAQLRAPTVIAELNTFEQKKDETKEKVTRVEGELKNIDVQIETILDPEKINIQKLLKQHDKEEEMFKKEKSDLSEKIKGQDKELLDKDKKEKEFYSQFKELFNKRNKITEKIQKDELAVRDEELKIHDIETKINNISLDNARITAELTALEQELEPIKEHTLMKGKSEEELKREVSKYERTLENMGAVNMRALEIYEKVEHEYNNLLDKKKKLELEKEDVISMMNEIEAKKKDIFMKTFDSVNETFQKFFTVLSRKGDAFLEVENKESPFEGGIAINVRITGKKFLDIRSLSGGEKTLTALAFIFSIQEHDPASFYVLDEVDAALDKHNSEKLAGLIRKYADKSQYLIISHNDGIISEADTLYGVSMNEHGMSKVVSLKI